MIITFRSTNINHLPERVFKSVLVNKYNVIHFTFTLQDFISTIDCDDCKNLWLIKEEKGNQIINAHCKDDYSKMLFDKEIQDKLTKKCK